MYTLAQIELAAVRVFASVKDPEDRPSQTRMRKITQLYFSMLAHKSASVDEDALDSGTALLVSHFLTGAGAQDAAELQQPEALGLS